MKILQKIYNLVSWTIISVIAGMAFMEICKREEEEEKEEED